MSSDSQNLTMCVGGRAAVVDALVRRVRAGASVIVTGERGIGRTHLARAVAERLRANGMRPTFVVGTPGASGMPLGAFAGTDVAESADMASPVAIVGAFARSRSGRTLIVDDIDHLDSASQYVVAQLIQVTGIPAVLTVRDGASLPAAIASMLDAGLIAPQELTPMTPDEGEVMLRELLGGDVTPRVRLRILEAAGGNPLALHAIARGSAADGRLRLTEHGWELFGAPSAAIPAVEWRDDPLRRLTDAERDTAGVVAIAGGCPADALAEAELCELARHGVVDVSADGLVTIAHPIDASRILAQIPSPLRKLLARRAIDALRGEGEAPCERRIRAANVAIEHGGHVETADGLLLAAQALATLDDELALRASLAVIERDPSCGAAMRIAGLAASLRGDAARADELLAGATAFAVDDQARAEAAIATAHHLGSRHLDPTRAVGVLQDALGSVTEPGSRAALAQAATRWGSVAGVLQGADAPVADSPAAGATALVFTAMSGVISGPLDLTERAIPMLRALPDQLIDAVPGTAALVDLADVMALSYSGDVTATRRRLEKLIAHSTEAAPESLGDWSYALGILELFSSDAERAHANAERAVTHLRWRDPSGLLPAACALVGAAATATGRSIEAHRAFESVPQAAAVDPKVMMLRAWARARQAAGERQLDRASEQLVAAAEGLRDAQHIFFSGMLASCAVRMERRVDHAADLVRCANDLGGGGLLQILARHADAVVARDADALEAVAAEASELGLITVAVDAYLALARWADDVENGQMRARRLRFTAEQTRAGAPAAVLWQAPSEGARLLTERELQVVLMAAERYSAKEIAAAHRVSVHTVNNQLASAFRKLGVAGRTELREVVGGLPPRGR